jgi:hypothetical protein
MLIFQSFAGGLGFGVAAETQLVDLLGKLGFIGPGMSGVTGQAAILALQRFMGDPGFFRGVPVAGKTEGITAGNEQSIVIRGMDVVAREAISAFKWLMLDGSASHQVTLVVTGETELLPFFLGGERLGGRGENVAVSASTRCHRLMGTHFHQIIL